MTRTLLLVEPREKSCILKNPFPLAVFSVISNGFVFGIVARFKKLRNYANILIANLVLVDLLNALINIPMYLLYSVLEVSWFKGKTLAVVSLLFYRLFLLLNITSMLILLVNVFLALTFDLTTTTGTKKLKRHTEKGTCPANLRYKARARIRADNEFKNDISRIRKNAQQECVKALTRFHYRECDRFRGELQKEKRPRVPKKNATGTVVNKSFAKKETCAFGA